MPRRQRGVALVVAVLVVALGAFLAATMLRGLLLDLRRAGHAVSMEQAYQYARGLEAWAAAILAEDQSATGTVDHHGEPWAKGIPFIDVPGGRLTGRLVDLDGRFNLNNLVLDGARSELQVAIFRRLLDVLGLDPSVAERAVDWIDGDVMPEQLGAEDNSYLRMDPPYRTANQPFAHVSELRAVLGMTGEAWARLAPHVTAVPVRGEPLKINLNTATPPVVAALHEGIDLGLADELLRSEGLRFESVDRFLEHPRLQLIETAALAPLLTVGSRYFRAEGIVELADRPVRFHALLERVGSETRVLHHSRGVF